ncbi:MAG: DedA family protein [Chloroflexota bacterium]|jgi:membrane protein DedA with SNARE-associated domain
MESNELLLNELKNIGAPFLGLALLVAEIGIPIPSAVLLLAAGGFGRQGFIDLRAALLVGWLGVVIGDCGGYTMGRLGDVWLMQHFQRKRPTAWLKARARFQRHDSKAVFVTRCFIPALDFPTNLLAGSFQYPFKQFLTFVILGRFIWITGHLILGYALGEQWPAIVRFLEGKAYWVGGLIMFILSIYLLWDQILFLVKREGKNWVKY